MGGVGGCPSVHPSTWMEGIILTTMEDAVVNRTEGKILAIVLWVCAVVLGLGGWAIVLNDGWIGWLLVLAAVCAFLVGQLEWSWK